MTENVSVKFRWFRTVETNSEIVTLIYNDQEWSEIKLLWDSHKLLFESSSSSVPLGKHETILVIEGKRHPCQPFTVVETTFEVNLFLRNDDIQQTYDNSPNFYSMERSFTLSPLRIDTTWPPTLLSRDTEFSRELLLKPSVSTDVVSSRSSPQNKVDDLLAMKDVEISHLRTEVKQLRQLVNEMDVTLTFLRMNNKSKVWHAHKMIEELNTLQKEKRNIELEAQSMASSLQENKDCRESLEWEVDELRKQLNSNDPAEVTPLIMEMRTLREELCNVCRMNKELVEEVLTLREENARLKSLSAEQSSQQMKSDVTIYYSDPDSGSTQYRQLPITNSSSSKSLPAALLAERVEVPQRSISLDPVHISPVSSDSLLTDELLNFGTPPKVVSGVQTDITALHGDPVHYRKKINKARYRKKSCIKNRLSKSNSKKRKTVTSTHTPAANTPLCYATSRSFKEERDSSDTEELLQEAEQFLLNVTSSNNGILNRVTNTILNSGPVFGNHHVITNVSRNAESERQARQSNCPFIPKCALDLQPGYSIRYHGNHGRITQGKVSFVGPLPDKVGTFVGVEDESFSTFTSSHSPNRTFIPFKKVILAWEKKWKK